MAGTLLPAGQCAAAKFICRKRATGSTAKPSSVKVAQRLDSAHRSSGKLLCKASDQQSSLVDHDDTISKNWCTEDRVHSHNGSSSSGQGTPGDRLTTLDSSSLARLQASVGGSSFLAASLLGFGVVATDVCAPGSFHLLQPLDSWAHATTVQLLSPSSRALADHLFSDVFITLGLVGWGAAGLVAISNKPADGLRTCGVATAMYLLGAGSLYHADPPLVDALKWLFHRMRPSAVHHSFAFPSGHTAAATFIMGTLLLVLLPAALAAANGGGRDPGAADRLERGLSRVTLPLWGMSAVVTAVSRIMGDAHWVSDTVAGACLGASMVSVTAMLVASSRNES